MKHASFLFLILGTIGCYILPDRRSRKAFQSEAFCYQNKSVGLERRINLNGYYVSPEYPTVAAVFLKDGRYIDHLWMRDSSDGAEREFEGPFIVNGPSNWGTYKLNGDTIKAAYIYTAYPPWFKEERWYRIIDAQTIETIARSDQHKPMVDKKTGQYAHKYLYTGRRHYFVRNDSMPEFKRSWIMKKRWFWCDEAAYEAWMDSIKSNP
jgi:hypothetical protein